jgi:hypothetical protein
VASTLLPLKGSQKRRVFGGRTALNFGNTASNYMEMSSFISAFLENFLNVTALGTFDFDINLCHLSRKK